MGLKLELLKFGGVVVFLAAFGYIGTTEFGADAVALWAGWADPRLAWLIAGVSFIALRGVEW